MNNKIQNRVRMYQATLGFLQKTPGVIKLLVPLIVTATSAFETIVISILQAIAAADALTEGTTLSKKECRENLFNVSDSVARAIIAFANSTGNTQLAKDMQEKRTLLDKIGETIFVSRCKDINKAAVDNLDDLAPVGVTQAVVDLFDDRIEAYVAIKDEGRQIASGREAALTTLKALMKDATKILRKQLDPLVYSIQGYDEWVDSYRNNRKIIDLGHKYTTFKGATKKANSEEFIYNVALEFRNKQGEVFTINSNVKGQYRERLNPDIYDITATHPEFLPFTIEGVEILPGEIKVENISLVPKP